MVVVEAMLESLWRCFGEPYPNNDSTCGLTEAETLARARRQAQQNQNKPLPRKLSSSSASLDKSRIRSNKRKADIFRTKVVPEEERPPRPMPYHGILCFANPIQSDGQEQEQQQQQDHHDGDETVTSTIYFDAKYKDVVQSRPPMPLYMEYSVPVTEEDDDEIAKIVQNGTHKSIHMFMDGENIQSRWYQEHICKTPSQDKQEEDVECSSASQELEQSPLVTTSRLEVISDWVGLGDKKRRMTVEKVQPPGLKLLSNSSVSTAALTAVGSSRSMISLTRQNSTSA
uniref:Uncharacterized protein n=1 Tax=Eucampia antarctica TaxID=49252 RepID=A0A7S2W4B2_9STRA|mmetsp:Transcript_20530/g.19771  ORF Transcript_20530/g.19771 Transcript_20530/m.19771 type:complete len:285 (+) Transcript_20530:257-1111(+)|eukprot:CAMPEP_0197825956 /NCGR_PEP_ID=MMETSP1437-20131217/2980_1 /TAXON_ID=49252 ORGANISM="Eucampia antarctica, Strain CCMP1452" /NCGR_SAMPLE_ID=MMETSP1437 /ASSEMBLY_ACC=CAM_ASM_001096 /LENGTH=284 /DNA_ID=CAMNT_0043426185 /DNA_START=246 /DNA_END=1100 /DNA_ORIENTATION=+